MDCETSNDLLLDLAYGELDEVRAAALRKHIDACAECRESLRKLTRGRSLARQLTLDEPPPVSALLRAAIEARVAPAGSAASLAVDDGVRSVASVVPLAQRRTRVARLVERVGEFAMRRQVAMAAVFLLMIGVGLIFYQTHPRPTDSGDDRVPDVVPAVEVPGAPRGGGATAAAPVTRRTVSAPGAPRTAVAAERDERGRTYAAGTGTEPVWRPGPAPTTAPELAPMPSTPAAHSSASAATVRHGSGPLDIEPSFEGAGPNGRTEDQSYRAGAPPPVPTVATAPPSPDHGPSAPEGLTQDRLPPLQQSEVAQRNLQNIQPSAVDSVATPQTQASNAAMPAGGPAADAARIAQLRAALAQAPDDTSRARIAGELARLLEQSGRNDEAATVLAQVRASQEAAAPPTANAPAAYGGSMPSAAAPSVAAAGSNAGSGGSANIMTSRAMRRPSAPRAAPRPTAYPMGSPRNAGARAPAQGMSPYAADSY